MCFTVALKRSDYPASVEELLNFANLLVTDGKSIFKTQIYSHSHTIQNVIRSILKLFIIQVYRIEIFDQLVKMTCTKDVLICMNTP